MIDYQDEGTIDNYINTSTERVEVIRALLKIIKEQDNRLQYQEIELQRINTATAILYDQDFRYLISLAKEILSKQILDELRT